MNRQEAARVLVRMRAGIEDTLAYEQHSAKGYQNLYESREALQMGAEALMPWARTADRLPEGDDFDIVLVEYASDGLILPTNIGNVRDKPYLMPWWMPIPPLPDHIADAGKKEADHA